MTVQIIKGDCVDVFRGVTGLEAIVSDIPSYMKFMGRPWDTSAPDKSYVPPIEPRSKKHLRELQERHTFVRYWAERLAIAYDACAEDAVALIWAIPKQADATMEAMRLAGWRIADTITHLFGQGWPKSKRELKPASELWILGIKGSPKLGIDACRVERGGGLYGSGAQAGKGNLANQTGNGRTRGGGTGIVAESNPLGSWPTNAVLSHCEDCIRDGVRRVKGGASTAVEKPATNAVTRGAFSTNTLFGYGGDDGTETLPAYRCACVCDCGARWLVLAGGNAPRCQCGRMARWACPVAALDAMSGTLKSGARAEGVRNGCGYGSSAKGDGGPALIANEGGASRFFNTFAYFAKASGRVDKETGIPRGERHAGCEDLYWREDKSAEYGFLRVSREEHESLPGDRRARGNIGATVKSIHLMRHLHALTGAKKIGDLSAGSGSGMIAAFLDGLDWIGAEVCQEAIEIAQARLAFWGKLSVEDLALFTKKRAMSKV